jgi:hypothetical protein
MYDDIGIEASLQVKKKKKEKKKKGGGACRSSTMHVSMSIFHTKTVKEGMG